MIQWVPAHKDVLRNKRADRAAKKVLSIGSEVHIGRKKHNKDTLRVEGEITDRRDCSIKAQAFSPKLETIR